MTSKKEKFLSKNQSQQLIIIITINIHIQQPIRVISQAHIPPPSKRNMSTYLTYIQMYNHMNYIISANESCTSGT